MSVQAVPLPKKSSGNLSDEETLAVFEEGKRAFLESKAVADSPYAPFSPGNDSKRHYVWVCGFKVQREAGARTHI